MAAGIDEEGTFLEGHICPNCKKIFSGILGLQQHFEICISSSDHDSRTQLDTLKRGFTNIIDKAKNKLKPSSGPSTTSSPQRPAPHASPDAKVDQANRGTVSNAVGWSVFQENQTLGAEVDWTASFIEKRGKCLLPLHQKTCRLIENLHKLLSALSKAKLVTPAKLKEVEQSVVKWLPDQSVAYCKGCRRSFGATRRRHHCRVCGGITCKRCSGHFGYKEAVYLVEAKLGYKCAIPSKKWDIKKPKSKGPSVDGEDENSEKDGFLVDDYCEYLLVKQLDQIKKTTHKPVQLLALYDRLIALMREVDSFVPNYTAICKSLLSGETTYGLEDAQLEKVKIVKPCEKIDSISKQIASLRSETGHELSKRESMVHQNIRQFAAFYLQSNLFCLQPLPNQEELDAIIEAKEKARKEMERLAELERVEKRRREQEAAKQSSLSLLKARLGGISQEEGASARVHIGAETTDQAWIPESNQVVEEEDPFLAQYEKLIGYIEQAKLQNKMDEVEALQESLKQIERTIIERRYETSNKADVLP